MWLRRGAGQDGSGRSVWRPTRPQGGRRSSDVWGWGRWGVWSKTSIEALSSAVYHLSSSPAAAPLNFVPTPKKVPIMDHIAGVEAALQRTKLPQDTSEEIRAKVCCLFRNTPKPKPNLSTSQAEAIKSLRKRDDIVILKADKGNATVLLDKEDYHQKCCELLQPPTYLPLPRNPTSRVERRVTEVLNDLKKKGALDKTLFQKLKPSLSRAPRFYGLPKIHKPGSPLRPIVSAIGSPTYNIAKFVTSIISPLMGNTSSYVKNSKHFSEMISSETVAGNELMVSFDVKSLFTNVPIEHALEVIHRRLLEDETLEDRTQLSAEQVTLLLSICLRTTYFVYQNQFYEQTEGAAMGSPVSPVVANIYMEYVEEAAIATSPSPVRFWRRYVDDTFCFLQESSVELVLNHLNSISPSINFTVEQEKDNILPFLDALVSRNEDGTLKVSVFRKQTHTDRYLPYESHHPFHVKRGVVRCLVKRAEEISSDDGVLKQEMKHLRTVLSENGYPTGLVKPTQKKNKDPEEDEEKPLTTAVIPYSQGLSEQIRRVLRMYNIRTAFRSGTSLGKFLTRVKDPVPLEDRPGAIYKISCLCGDSYIGETGRTTNKRVKEHKAACRLAHFEKSAVAEHAWQDGHIIEWDQVTILDTASDQRERQTKEALYIKLAPPGCRINRDEGKDLSPLWLNAIKNSQRRGRRRGREVIDGRGQGLDRCLRPHPQRPHPHTSEDRRPPCGRVGRHTLRPLPSWPAPLRSHTPPWTVTI